MAALNILTTLQHQSASRALALFVRWLGRSKVAPTATDRTLIDSGLGRLSSATLEDIGAPPELLDQAVQREAWKTFATLDAKRHL
jgi:hypothetical protein